MALIFHSIYLFLVTHKKYVAILSFILAISLYLMHTTIILNKDTRDDLKKIGQKGQTYDDLIQELIKKWNDEN